MMTQPLPWQSIWSTRFPLFDSYFSNINRIFGNMESWLWDEANERETKPDQKRTGMGLVRFDPSSDTSCPVYPVLALAHASPSVFIIRFMYIDMQPLAP